MRTTKQQLQQQVEALRVECDRLRTENAALRAECDRLRSRSATTPKPKQRPKFVVPPEEEARRAEIRRRMAIAKETAIREKRTVVV